MQKEYFFMNSGKQSITLERMLKHCASYEEFEKTFSDDFLNEDTRIGDYLQELLFKYDKKASAVSEDAGLATSYVGLIINGKKNNPSRDALISICLTIGTEFEEVQYLLKYAGQAPLYVRRKRDVVVWFGFMKRQDIDTVNGELIKRGLRPLINEK